MHSHCSTSPGAGEALSNVTWGHRLRGVEIASTHQMGNWNGENMPMSRGITKKKILRNLEICICPLVIRTQAASGLEAIGLCFWASSSKVPSSIALRLHGSHYEGKISADATSSSHQQEEMDACLLEQVRESSKHHDCLGTLNLAWILAFLGI